MLKDTITKIAVGSAGIVSSEAVPNVIDTIVTQPSEVVSVIVQIIIGIATLFGLFKKKSVAKKS